MAFYFGEKTALLILMKTFLKRKLLYILGLSKFSFLNDFDKRPCFDCDIVRDSIFFTGPLILTK